MRKYGCIAFLSILALAGCGGAGSSPQPVPTVAPRFTVTFTRMSGGLGIFPTETITVRDNGWATKTVNGATSYVEVPAALSAQVFADVQAAQPLSALPFGGYPDFAIVTVSEQGQTSPDINPGDGSATEAALLGDFINLTKLFP